MIPFQLINVSCAIIRNDDEQVLVVQRGPDTDHPFKWEFPGGKVKKGESFEDSVIREVEEELALEIIIVDSLISVEHDYGIKQIRLIPFVCDTLMDMPVLNEHNDYSWLDVSELRDVDFSEADVPIAREYVLKYGGTENSVVEIDDSIPDNADGIEEMLSGKSGFWSIDMLVKMAIEDQKIINLLLKYSLEGNSTLSFRASYSLIKIEEGTPGFLKPYYAKLISAMPGLKHEGVTRSFLKILTLTNIAELDSEYHGILTDCCFNWLNDSKSSIAIKAYSMELLYNLTLIYPELAFELSASIARNIEEGSAGIKARGRQILNKLSKK